MEWLSDIEREALGLSLRVAIWSVGVSLPLAIAVAFALARGRFPGRQALNAVVHLPLVLPPVVVGYTLLSVFGNNSLIGAWLEANLGFGFAFSWRGAALAAGVMAFPLMVRAIRISIEALDRQLEAAARTLGATPFRVFFTITLPLILPGILTGAILAFARSLGEFGATITFVSNIPYETRTLAIALYGFTQSPGGDSQAIRLGVISVVIGVLALVASEWLAGRVQQRITGG
jgi:molybdate transport system permease protein